MLGRSLLFATQTASLRGGVERWLADTAVGLSERGWRVDLALIEGAEYHRAERYLAAWPQLAKLPVNVARAPSGLAWERQRILERRLIEVRPEIVVPVLVHDALAACATRRSAGDSLRVAYPIHESEVWAFDAVADQAGLIDGVVSVNRLMLDALQQWLDWSPERSFHVPCGVPLPPSSAQRFAGSGPLRLGFCGRLAETQKRVGDLVPLCRELARLGVPYRLTVAGAGPEEARLRRELASEVAAGSVELLGWLDAEALATRFYSAIDALVVTSDWETGPLVAWEAMARGVLVVTSRYRGLRRENILRDGESALVFPVGAPEAAADRLARESRDRLSEIAARGRELAFERLGLEAMIEGWEQALTATLTAPPRPPAQPVAGKLRSKVLERAEATLRSRLGRGRRASGAHDEWPRYRPGVVTEGARLAFADRLDSLETRLTTPPSRAEA